MASRLTAGRGGMARAARIGAGDRMRPPAASVGWRPSPPAWPGLLAPPRIAQAMVLLLASVTALALLGIGLTLGGPPAYDARPAAATQSGVIRGFYDAVNTVLAGGGAGALDPYVAPDVVVHAPNGQIDGRAALAARLAALAAGAPGARIAVGDLIVDGDRAAADVEWSASSHPAPGVVIEGAAAPVAATERFRIADGRIVEYWRQLDDRDTTRVLPPLPLSLWLGSKRAELARFLFPPGAALVEAIASGPHLIVPETGALTVSLSGEGEIARGDAAGWRPTTASERTLTLQPGDALLVPADIVHTIRNATAGGASMIGVLFDWEGTALASNARMYPGPQTPTLVLMYSGSSTHVPEVWNGGVTVEPLARGADICAARETGSLAVAWLTLEPGQRIAPRPVAGVALLAVETGALLVGQPHPAITTTEAALPSGSVPGWKTGAEPPANPAVAMAGDGVAFSTGLSALVANMGTAPARVALVSLGPGIGSARASPAALAALAASAPCQPNAADGAP